MNKLQYRSSEAPTPWGIVNVPEEPIEPSRIGRLAAIEYNEALELALKKENRIPIRVEDQERVNETIWRTEFMKTISDLYINWKPSDESKLYDTDGMEFELNDTMSPRIKINNQTEGAIIKQFYALKPKVEEKKPEFICSHGCFDLQKDCLNHGDYVNCVFYKVVEEQPKEETAISEFFQTGEIKSDIVGDFFEKFIERMASESITVKEFKNSDTRLSLLWKNNRVSAFVIETRTEFNDVQFIKGKVEDTKETDSQEELWNGVAAILNQTDNFEIYPHLMDKLKQYAKISRIK